MKGLLFLVSVVLLSFVAIVSSDKITIYPRDTVTFNTTKPMNYIFKVTDNNMFAKFQLSIYDGNSTIYKSTLGGPNLPLQCCWLNMNAGGFVQIFSRISEFTMVYSLNTTNHSCVHTNMVCYAM